MVSNIIYFLRIKGDKEWTRYEEHPARPIDGVVSLWAKSQRCLEDGVTVQVARSEDSQIEEVVYRD